MVSRTQRVHAESDTEQVPTEGLCPTHTDRGSLAAAGAHNQQLRAPQKQATGGRTADVDSREP